MKLTINEKDYQIDSSLSMRDPLRFTIMGVEKPDVENLGEEIFVKANNDFVMNSFKVADYKRWYMSGYTLYGTNTPEPEPIPEPEPYVPTVEEVQSGKINELSNTCSQIIYAGTDVEYNKAKKHYTYTVDDQINLSQLFSTLLAGATAASYHADGEPCRMYDSAELINLYVSLAAFKTSHLTYFNQMKQYIKSLEDKETITAIKYGDKLTGEYLENYNKIMVEAKAQIEAVIAKIGK